uniref:Basic leucine zipper domain-containing protein n=1 Tax=Ditylenchus dipsaci TaxID=166011 RepID=A0A915DYC1_9BILA
MRTMLSTVSRTAGVSAPKLSTATTMIVGVPHEEADDPNTRKKSQEDESKGGLWRKMSYRKNSKQQQQPKEGGTSNEGLDNTPPNTEVKSTPLRRRRKEEEGGFEQLLRSRGAQAVHYSAEDSSSNTSLSNCQSPILPIDDDQLTQLSVRELNQRLLGHDRATVSALKQKRRTLKNRGYALNCRARRQQTTVQLQAENQVLRANLRQMGKKLDLLQCQLQDYQEYAKLSESAKIVDHKKVRVKTDCATLHSPEEQPQYLDLDDLHVNLRPSAKTAAFLQRQRGQPDKTEQYCFNQLAISPINYINGQNLHISSHHTPIFAQQPAVDDLPSPPSPFQSPSLDPSQYNPNWKRHCWPTQPQIPNIGLPSSSSSAYEHFSLHSDNSYFD